MAWRLDEEYRDGVWKGSVKEGYIINGGHVTIYYNTLIIIPITESFNNLIKGPHQANITSKILTNTVMAELIHTSCRSESSNCSLVILDKLLHVLQ